MRTYTPNTILIPQEIKEHPTICSYLLHHLRTLEKAGHNHNIVETWDAFHLDTPLEQLLTVEEKKAHLLAGAYPLFHDIFLREYQGGQQIVAMGIEEGHILQFIGRPEIWHNGKQLTYTSVLKEEKGTLVGKGIDLGFGFNLRLYIINPDPGTSFQPNDTLELRWTKVPFSFTRTVRLQAYPWLNDTPKLTLNTLQKDNPLEWIRDWILYHHRAHGVGRVLLYDNGSHNQEELKALLSQIESEQLEICLIPWNITYAPFALSECQLGAITHAYYWLWDKTLWNVNCDIDEYLINRTGMSLQKYLQRYSTRTMPILLIPDIDVNPYRTEANDPSLVTDFQQVDTSFTSIKSMTRGAEAIYMATPHAAHSCTGLLSNIFRAIKYPRHKPQNLPIDQKQRKPKKSMLISYALSYSYMLWPQQEVKTESLKTLRRIVCSSFDFFPPCIKKIFFVCRRREWGLYFYHYAGLTNHWKTLRDIAPHSQTSKTLPPDTVKDEEALEALKKAGVGKYYEEVGQYKTL